jgi:hypothetical protein
VGRVETSFESKGRKGKQSGGNKPSPFGAVSRPQNNISIHKPYFFFAEKVFAELFSKSDPPEARSSTFSQERTNNERYQKTGDFVSGR